MKKLLSLLLFILVAGSSAEAQHREKPFAIGPWGGITQYNGDLGNGFYDFDQAAYGHAGLNLSWFLGPRWDFAIVGTYGEAGYHKDENFDAGWRAKNIQGNFHFRFNIISSDHKVIPYLLAGAGATYFKDYGTTEGTDFQLPVGGGFRFRLGQRWNLILQETLSLTNGDKRDDVRDDDDESFLMHSAGLTYNFQPKKDADMDGVADKHDKCPNTPSGVKVDRDGCPLDRDGDKVADYLDMCPDTPGHASGKGCPDRDGDTVLDSLDKCPDIFGSVAQMGCADADGDGIADDDDACPNVAGIAAFKGCPDTDGDGITDAEDQCPTEKGTLLSRGCPDTDGDGILDKDDKCPRTPGVAANNGCPEVKEEYKKVFQQALQGIQFETGKDVIRKSSFPVLDKVADILKTNPDYLMTIEGHTDDVGKDDLNMNLSQRRADSVKKYLENKGVAGSRMTAIGYGETKPVSDNKTAAGRTQNRRVEFKVSF